MQLVHTIIHCQVPKDTNNIVRDFNIIQCTIIKDSEEYNNILRRANELATRVNTATANNTEVERNLQRRQSDSFGGLLAEAGWEQYINSEFPNIAAPTPFTDTSTQIDIQLTNGERIEVRSSFPRNGVKFGLCNNRFNFRNIGPYSNSIKPAEIQKHLYLAVLFDSSKANLLSSNTIVFSLVGGSTWQRMVQNGYNATLKPEDDDFASWSNYHVIDLKNALDAFQILDAIAELGYARAARH